MKESQEKEIKAIEETHEIEKKKIEDEWKAELDKYDAQTQELAIILKKKHEEEIREKRGMRSLLGRKLARKSNYNSIN